MRTLISGCALTAALVLAAPAPAAEQKPDPEQSEIIVEGTRNRDRQISEFVSALTKARAFDQISRFEQPMCPLALGLSPAQNKSVADRLRSVAGAAGIPVGKDDCKPNTFVVVARGKAKMVKTLRENWADPLGDRVKIPKQSGPAVAVHLEGRMDGDDIGAGVKQQDGSGSSGYYETASGGAEASARIRPASRPHFLATALVVEPDALAGLTTTQLADYAAMRLLAKTDPARLEKSAAPTILTILDAPMDSEVPVTLTQWDMGFLKALYASGSGRYATQQRGEMQRLLKDELDTAQKSGK
ncbi:MAG TPA: hypothetical protein VGR19_08230 [Allosphingosinicella sp.]|nr:hypothetical protein [Allosphingosinicella sp.]